MGNLKQTKEMYNMDMKKTIQQIETDLLKFRNAISETKERLQALESAEQQSIGALELARKIAAEDAAEQATSNELE
jgi:hypothetical protein